jgi:hypothetical protein
MNVSPLPSRPAHGQPRNDFIDNPGDAPLNDCLEMRKSRDPARLPGFASLGGFSTKVRERTTGTARASEPRGLSPRFQDELQTAGEKAGQNSPTMPRE